MSDAETTYGGATGRLSGQVELIGEEPLHFRGRVYVAGARYDADDPGVLVNRKWFRVASERLGDPEE